MEGKCMKNILIKHVKTNKKEYLKFLILLIFGFFCGLFFLKNLQNNNLENISIYINNLIKNIKSAEDINSIILLKESLQNNVTLLIFIWFLGCTIFGKLLIYGTIFYRGFSLGYTVSAICVSTTLKTSLIFFTVNMILPNIIFLISVFFIANSGIQLGNNFKNKNLNMKSELIKHTLVMLISIMISVISSFFETFVTIKILMFLKEFL